MTVQMFLNAVKKIADAGPSYREGGIGTDGTCDCIGLIMGALYACGQPAYDMHSSNYFARYQTGGLQTIAEPAALAKGMVVFKARNGANTLHERYLPGGRYHTGDLNDYYHAGVVENIQPLVIVHCTSAGGISGIARDHELGGWTHCGYAAGVTADDALSRWAVVTADSGETVNLRKYPRKTSDLVTRVPLGSRVLVEEKADGWARVCFDGLRGYMMEPFLQQESKQTDWVRLPRKAVLDMIETLRACVPEDEKEGNG